MLETTNGTNVKLTAEQVLETARALIPVVRERGPLGDAARKLPEETVEDFKRLGLVRTSQPARFGGMEHDLETLHLASMEIARGDGASGWLASFFGIHQFNVGWFPLEAQEEYWADDPNTLASTVAAFHFAREEVPGGVRISGRGKFSSGIDYADWLLVFTQKEGCMIPRSDFEIIDDWQVSGLHGTGSKGMLIEDVFVPNHRIVRMEQFEDLSYDGARLYASPWYGVYKPNAVGHAIIFPLLGMARGVADIFEERVRDRTDPQTLLPAIERPGPAMRFAESSAELDVAESLALSNLAVIRESGAAREPLSLEARATIRRNLAYAAKLCLQSTNRLVDAMDSSALYLTSGLHRQARDVRAGALQFTFHWEETAIQYSRVRWGLEPHTILI